jgi:hypothetical protein
MVEVSSVRGLPDERERIGIETNVFIYFIVDDVI